MQRPARTARCRCQRRAPSPGKGDGPIPRPRTPPDLTRNGARPATGLFYPAPISSPRRHRLVRCHHCRSLRGFALSLEGRAAAPILMAAKGPDRLLGPDDRSPCLLPVRLFSVSSHNARMPQTLADPAGGRSEALDLLPAMRGSTFFPRRCASSSRVKKGSPLLILHWRFGPCGCGPDRPRQLIAIEAAMVVAKRKTKGE